MHQPPHSPPPQPNGEPLRPQGHPDQPIHPQPGHPGYSFPPPGHPGRPARSHLGGAGQATNPLGPMGPRQSQKSKRPKKSPKFWLVLGLAVGIPVLAFGGAIVWFLFGTNLGQQITGTDNRPRTVALSTIQQSDEQSEANVQEYWNNTYQQSARGTLTFSFVTNGPATVEPKSLAENVESQTHEITENTTITHEVETVGDLQWDATIEADASAPEGTIQNLACEIAYNGEVLKQHEVSYEVGAVSSNYANCFITSTDLDAEGIDYK